MKKKRPGKFKTRRGRRRRRRRRHRVSKSLCRNKLFVGPIEVIRQPVSQQLNSTLGQGWPFHSPHKFLLDRGQITSRAFSSRAHGQQQPRVETHKYPKLYWKLSVSGRCLEHLRESSISIITSHCHWSVSLAQHHHQFQCHPEPNKVRREGGGGGGSTSFE